jgi:hypothetical protein
MCHIVTLLSKRIVAELQLALVVLEEVLHLRGRLRAYFVGDGGPVAAVYLSK